MKITESYLKKIIREEKIKLLKERESYEEDPAAGMQIDPKAPMIDYNVYYYERTTGKSYKTKFKMPAGLTLDKQDVDRGAPRYAQKMIDNAAMRLAVQAGQSPSVGLTRFVVDEVEPVEGQQAAAPAAAGAAPAAGTKVPLGGQVKEEGNNYVITVPTPAGKIPSLVRSSGEARARDALVRYLQGKGTGVTQATLAGIKINAIPDKTNSAVMVARIPKDSIQASGNEIQGQQVAGPETEMRENKSLKVSYIKKMIQEQLKKAKRR